jgi:glycosyltransferase involved in cell wall biosynthesis
VHMTASDPAAALVERIARQHGTRVVVTARGALTDIWTRENCFAHTAISKEMAAVNQPLTDLEIDVVRNSLDVSRYAPPAAPSGGAPIVAFAGRTTALEKDFPRFTRIARRLAARGARVWIADPHEGTWDKHAGRPVERVDVERWGFVPHLEMPDFYRAVAASGGVLLVTSISEGFGNVAPEAAACGARVAAPDVIGLREAIVDGVTGSLFPADASDDDVAERVGAWLARPHDMAACAEAARTEFSPERMTDAYVRIYEREAPRVLSARPPASAESHGLGHLHEHLAKQPEYRAEWARVAAADFATAGRRGLALEALTMALRDAPRQLLTGAGIRQALGIGRRVVWPPRPQPTPA